MGTMKLDLSEWKNLAIGHLRLMANQLDQVGLIGPQDLQKIDAHWGDVIRPRLDAWVTESVIATQEQQRTGVIQQNVSRETSPEQTNGTALVKAAKGWPKGKLRGPRKPKTEALLNSAAVLPPVTQ